jgi:hypothetical protein
MARVAWLANATDQSVNDNAKSNNTIGKDGYRLQRCVYERNEL